MAKTIITNNRDSFNSSIKRIINSGLEKYSTISTDDTYIAVFEKRIHSIGNIFKDDNNDFIAISGTFIYKGITGIDALKSILNDFDGNVNIIKKECIGLYSIVIKKKSFFFIFNDYYGLYDINFFISNDFFFLSNSLSDVAGVNQLYEIDEFGLIQNIFDSGCFNEKTFFKKINKLKGDEYLKIEKNKIEKINIVEEPNISVFTSENDSLFELELLISKYSEQINKNFDNIALNITGGLDSRVVLASLLKSKSSIRLLYGKGNSTIAPTCNEDLEIVKNISSDFNLPLYVMNWNDYEVNSKCDFIHQNKLFNKYGFFNLIYAGNKNIFHEYENGIPEYPDFIEFGYFLESLRLREWAEELKKDYFTIDEFINDYYLNKGINKNTYYNLTYFKSYLKEEFSALMKKQGIEVKNGHISINDFERLRWNTARISDSRMSFFINQFTYSFPIFSIPEIHDLILSIPAEIIKSGAFQVKLAKQLNSNLVKYKVFSHRRLFQINKNNVKKIMITHKNIADYVFKNIKFIEKPLRYFYRIIFYKNYNFMKNKIFDEINQLEGERKIAPKNIFAADIRSLYSYRQFLIGYFQLFGNEK